MRNTVWDYKKGSNFENILSECESIDHWLSNALSIKFISYLEQKIDIIEKMYIAFLPEPPKKYSQSCWPKMYLRQNKSIWSFNSGMCVFEGNWLVNKCEYFFRGTSAACVIYIFSMISIFCSRYDINMIESALESQWSILSHSGRILSNFDTFL